MDNIKDEPFQNHYNGNTTSTTDENGWFDVNKQRSSTHLHSHSDYHEDFDQSFAQSSQIMRSNIVNFDEEKPMNNQLSLVGNYPKPVVIEMKFQMKSSNPFVTNTLTTTSTTSISSTSSNKSYLKDQRCFKKNSIRRRLNTDEPEDNRRTIPIFRKSDIDKVLPKESEREMVVSKYNQLI